MKISDAISIVAAASYTILIIQAFLVARKKTPHQAAAD
jgi:hypothetical protein